MRQGIEAERVSKMGYEHDRNECVRARGKKCLLSADIFARLLGGGERRKAEVRRNFQWVMPSPSSFLHQHPAKPSHCIQKAEELFLQVMQETNLSARAWGEEKIA